MDHTLPPPIDLSLIQSRRPEEASATWHVMLQEAERLNKLLRHVRASIMSLRRSVMGLTIISDEMEAILGSIVSGKVPDSWHFAYPSLKPLMSWTVDLTERVNQISKWGMVSLLAASRMVTKFRMLRWVYPSYPTKEGNNT